MLLGKCFIIAAVLAVSCAEEEYGPDSGEGEHFTYDEEERAKPYHFGYEIQDHNGKQHRHEHSDGDGVVKGSYGFTDDRGIKREVHYVADHFGFRAQVTTNEQGTANEDPADVFVHSV